MFTQEEHKRAGDSIINFMNWSELLNQKLKDPMNATGAAAAIIGGLGMLGMLFDFPDWLTILSFILWVSGIGVLVYHSQHGDKRK